MTPGSSREAAAAQRDRDRRADRRQQGRTLDEVVAATGSHRKTAGPLGAKRLQPFVPKRLDRLVACGELALDPEPAGRLRRASPATLARLLAPARATLPPRGRATTRAGTLLTQPIPSAPSPTGTRAAPAIWRWTWWRMAGSAPKAVS